MIRFVVENSHGTIELLGEDESYHLVRIGHLRERNLFVSRLVDAVGKSVGAPHDEDQPFGHVGHLLFEIGGKLHRGELLAVLVEQHDIIAGQERLQDEVGLPLLLLVGTEAFGIAQFGDDNHLERHIVCEPFAVLLDASDKVRFHRFSYDQ